MARHVRFHRFGGADVLQLEEVDVPLPSSGEVRVRVEAIGINRAEVLFRSGAYIEEADFPSGIGLEAAGVVESVSIDVNDLSPGDRVALIPPLSMKQRPVHGTLINYPADLVVKTPLSQSSEQAAATWMAFLTAYGALVDLARITKVDYVVITAASSSVGLAALQIVGAIGATPIAVTRSSHKRDALLDAGAAHVVVADNATLAQDIRAITGPSGARVIFDAVGGATVAPLAGAAAARGIIIGYGPLDTRPTVLPPAALLGGSLTLRGYLVHEVIRDPVRLSAAKAYILEGLVAGRFTPTIARTFPLDEIAAAHRFLESNEQFGKVIVVM